MTGEQLKKLMKRLNMSRNQFAQLIGFSYRTVASWEREGTTPAMAKHIQNQIGVEV